MSIDARTEFGVCFNQHRIGQDLYLYECGFEICKPTKPFEYIPIDYYLIHYCTKGEGFLTVNGVERQITSGDIFFIPPYTENRYYPKKENPWAYHWIGIQGNLAKFYIEDCGLTKENFVLHSDKNEVVLVCFQKIYEYCTSQNYLIAMGYLYYFLGSLTKKTESTLKKHAQISSGEVYYTQIIEYINKNYFNDISISNIAIEFCIDRTYIYKLFKKNVNVSPQQYLLHFRINKACELLKKSRLDITQISSAVGFNSPNYFSKQFTIKMGISPYKYRKQFIK